MRISRILYYVGFIRCVRCAAGYAGCAAEYAECAAGLLLTDAQAVLQQEQEKQRLDEASKLCMTNREMFEERERVAKYILDAPPKEARIVQQQLNQALEEYQNKPTNRLAKPIYRSRAMATPSADA